MELDDQNPKLCAEVNKGFIGLKRMINRSFDEAKADGLVSDTMNTEEITEMVFAGMLGASVLYGVDKSAASLDRAIKPLIEYVKRMNSR